MYGLPVSRQASRFAARFDAPWLRFDLLSVCSGGMDVIGRAATLYRKRASSHTRVTPSTTLLISRFASCEFQSLAPRLSRFSPATLAESGAATAPAALSHWSFISGWDAEEC